MNKTEISFQQALYIVTSKLKEDGDLYRAYKDNIAMSFKDEYSRHFESYGNIVCSFKDIHDIANNAADYFLKLWFGAVNIDNILTKEQ